MVEPLTEDERSTYGGNALWFDRLPAYIGPAFIASSRFERAGRKSFKAGSSLLSPLFTSPPCRCLGRAGSCSAFADGTRHNPRMTRVRGPLRCGAHHLSQRAVA